jgi:glycosyltransferase involved in cell wall biosynthesis
LSSISIITVTYNNISGLKKTIKNVHDQNVSNFEHIIIDGNSNDGTKTYLKTLSSQINWISEPDQGIYNAMNKGIKLAKGKWIIFMNAGDTFHSNSILNEFNTNDFKADVVYGDCSIQYDNGFERNRLAQSLDSLWKGMSFSHQSIFIKTTLLKTNNFNQNYKYCADFNQIFSLYKSETPFEYWTKKIAKIEAGGISDSKRYIATNEVYNINKKLEPKYENHLYFIPKIITGYLIVSIKSIIPKRIIKLILNLKYK